MHELRDPIHVFINLDDAERDIINSPHFQRLRHIHQLALTYHLYPGATHRRFEHSLGVMELAARIFDVVTARDHVDKETFNALKPLQCKCKLNYWRRVLRMAALCHDLGHLPFSHAGEKLLPSGWNHETFTCKLIVEKMDEFWCALGLNPIHVVKLAMGRENSPELPDWTTWEEILADIVVSDAFGADRMDYLLRDSHHAGVAYGKFDHNRLIDTLRILPRKLDRDPDPSGKVDFALGVEQGGLHSAEAMMLARYFMYSQVYFHHVRRIYDVHLQDFLQNWLIGGCFSTNLDEHLALTDNEVIVAMRQADRDEQSSLHPLGRRLMRREHFRLLYEPFQSETEGTLVTCQTVFSGLCNKFGNDYFRVSENNKVERNKEKEKDPLRFPVLMRNGGIRTALAVSDVLAHVPAANYGYVFAARSKLVEAEQWLKEEYFAQSTDEPKKI